MAEREQAAPAADRRTAGAGPANEGLYAVFAQQAAQAQAAELMSAGGGAMDPALAAQPAAQPEPATAADGQSQEANAGPEGAGGGGGAAAAAAPAPAAPTTEHTEVGTFIVYPDSHVGPLPPKGPAGEPMRQSQFVAELVTRRAQVMLEAVKVVTEVNTLLSYGALDWVITDAEATQALETLATLPLQNLAAAVTSIDTDRLLSNLPADAAAKPGFAKVVVALGEAGQPLAAQVLPGALTFANSDAEWALVAQFIARQEAGVQMLHVTTIPGPSLGRLGNNLGTVTFADAVLDMMFLLIPDADLPALQAVMGKRFGFTVGTRASGAWTADGLRRAYQILQRLPPGHVQDNDMLDMLLVDGTTDGGGYYRGSDDSAVIGYSDISKTGSYGRVMVDDGAGGQTDVGLNSSVNLFDTVMRHEIGHAVDAKLGVSNDGGYTSTNAHAGKWKTYGSASAFCDDLIAASGGIDAHSYANAEAYEKAIRRAVAQGENFNTALTALKTAGDVPNDVAAADATTGGPVAAVFTADLWQSSQSPWYRKPDRPAVGGRQFHQAYSSKYASFQADARTQYGISAYQFRAPGEWFAEAYAVYYSDHDSATGARPGTRLRSRDSKTADWFDTNVDKGHSLPKETNQEGEGGGGGGSGTTSAGDGRAASEAGA